MLEACTQAPFQADRHPAKLVAVQIGCPDECAVGNSSDCLRYDCGCSDAHVVTTAP